MTTFQSIDMKRESVTWGRIHFRGDNIRVRYFQKSKKRVPDLDLDVLTFRVDKSL